MPPPVDTKYAKRVTIVPLADPTLPFLTEAARSDAVVSAMNEALDACGRLRFHEGLRRGWEEARAEAAVREATALAICAGVRTHVDDIRIITMHDARGEDNPLDPGEEVALGIWRSQWNLVQGFVPLNTRFPQPRAPRPLPALAAGIHRDVTSAAVASGHLSLETVARPSEHMAWVMGIWRSSLPALVRAACVCAHFRFREVFTPSSAAVGAALARSVLVTEGVDPSAVAVVSAYDAEDPARAQTALGGWVAGDVVGLARWMTHYAHAVRYGAEVGEDVAFHVQARTLGNSSSAS